MKAVALTGVGRRWDNVPCLVPPGVGDCRQMHCPACGGTAMPNGIRGVASCFGRLDGVPQMVEGKLHNPFWHSTIMPGKSLLF